MKYRYASRLSHLFLSVFMLQHIIAQIPKLQHVHHTRTNPLGDFNNSEILFELVKDGILQGTGHDKERIHHDGTDISLISWYSKRYSQEFSGVLHVSTRIRNV